MNVVREINRINDKELELATGAGSWHDQYKDSAYIFIGGLNFELTEGDVITVFSQYGEVVDIDMPRDKATGKRRGFAFLMYEDQRSTVLAVDNLNGAQLLGRTLRVDHTLNYKQKELVDGKWVERETERLNVKPELLQNDKEEQDSDSASSIASVDKEDPMRDYLIAQKREEGERKRIKSKKSKRKDEDETPEERRARKERKRAKKLVKQKGEEGEGRHTERRRIGDRPSSSRRDDDGAGYRRRSSSPPSRKHERRSRSASPRRSSHHRDDRSRSRTPQFRGDRDDRGHHESDNRDPRRRYE